MNLWRLLSARIRNGRGRVLFLMAAAALAAAVAIIDLAERTAPQSAWEIPVGLSGTLLAVTAAGFWQARARARAGQLLAGVSRQIRRAILAAYAGLEPPARAEVDDAAAQDALAALPSGLARPQAEAPAALQSYLTTIATVAVALLIDPVAGAALLLALKLAAIAATALVLRARGGDTALSAADAAVDQATERALHSRRRALLQDRAASQSTASPLDAAVAARRPLRARAAALAATEAAAGAPGRVLLAAALAGATRLAGESGDQAAAVLLIAFLVPLDWIETIPRLTVLAAAADRLAAFEAALQAAARRWPAPGAVAPAAFASIELRESIYAYPARPGQPGAIVGPVSCTAAPGRLLAVTGGQGAGKTTVLRMLAGLARPEGGEVLRDGEPADPRLNRAAAAYVPADPPLFAGTQIQGADRPAIQDLIQAMGLAAWDTVRAGRVPDPAALPTGARARLALVIAIASGRPLLLLDGIDSLLDPAMRAHFLGPVLAGLRDAGRAVVIATEDERIAALADETVRLADGRQA